MARIRFWAPTNLLELYHHMSKLRLKETPLEREERIAKERRRAARKERKKGAQLHFDYENDVEQRQWRLSEPTIYRAPEDTGVAYDQSASTSTSHAHRTEGNEGNEAPFSKPRPTGTSYGQIQKELEEANFRAKLFDAMDDDERLDSIEARFSAYRIPDRWKDDDSNSRDNKDTGDPNYMDDEEYAEWVRRGMWERRHRQEVEDEKQREQEREQERMERKRRKQQQKADIRKLEEESRRKQQENRAKVIRQAFEAYNATWASMTSSSAPTSTNLRFRDIPWPMMPQPKSPDDITLDTISTFLFSPDHSPEKSRKQRIRDAIFLYHPDRFEKWLGRISNDTEKHMAHEAAGRIVRFLTSLAE